MQNGTQNVVKLLREDETTSRTTWKLTIPLCLTQNHSNPKKEKRYSALQRTHQWETELEVRLTNQQSDVVWKSAADWLSAYLLFALYSFSGQPDAYLPPLESSCRRCCLGLCCINCSHIVTRTRRITRTDGNNETEVKHVDVQLKQR